MKSALGSNTFCGRPKGPSSDEPRTQARLWGTAAVGGQAIAKGARILRVHDVGPMVQTARMADALWR